MSSYILLEGGTDRLLLESGDILVLEDHVGGGSPQTLTVPLLDSSATLYAPTVTVGPVTITLPHIGPTGVLYEPTVTSGGLTLTVPHIGPTGTLYEPTITVGSVTIVLPHIGPTGQLYAFIILGGEQTNTYGPIHAYREPRTHTVREGRMSAQVTSVYRTVDEDPGIAYSWLDRDGSILDLSAATFSLVVTDLQGNVDLTKTSGITGAATSPNVIISWDAGELATLGAGTYLYKLTATVSSRQRTIGAGTPHRLIVTA